VRPRRVAQSTEPDQLTANCVYSDGKDTADADRTVLCAGCRMDDKWGYSSLCNASSEGLMACFRNSE